MRSILQRSVSTLVVTAYLAGCATRPDDIRPQYISPSAYETEACPQLGQRLGATRLRLAQLSELINHNANVDAARVAGAVAMALILPFWFVRTRGNGSQQAEYSRLLGEQQALQIQMQQKQCPSSVIPEDGIYDASALQEPSTLVDEPRTAELRAQLMSSDSRSVQRTAKSLVKAEVRDQAILDVVATKISVWQFTVDERQAEAVAWLCKVIGQSEDGRYKQMIAGVAAGALNPQIRKYAVWAADELPEGVTPQFVPPPPPPPTAEKPVVAKQASPEKSGATPAVQPSVPPPTTGFTLDASTRLQQLESLRKLNLISESEYQEKRQAIINAL